MSKVFLLIGSNLGNSQQMLEMALNLISIQTGAIINQSPIYSTSPWGNTEQPPFLNQVIEIETNLLPHQLLSHVLDIEMQMGRIRHDMWGPRLIDIDILFYGNEVLSGNLNIPHPLIHERRFVLVPMFALAPELVHPIIGKTIKQLLLECADNGNVELYNATVQN